MTALPVTTLATRTDRSARRARARVHARVWAAGLLVMLGLGSSHGVAAPAEGEEALTLSGFGTLGLAQTDHETLSFRRDGQRYGAGGSGIDAEVDSNLGLQLDWQARPGLGATLQLLAMRRQHRHANVEAEWAFVQAQLADSLRLRVGRINPPTYAVSASRRIGYANPWIRPPEEVYGLALIQRVDGLDLHWRGPPGALEHVEASALAGSTRVTVDGVSADIRRVVGLEVGWRPRRGVRLRAGHLQGEVRPTTSSIADRYRFSGVGLQIEQADWIAQSEFVLRRSASNPVDVDARAWYAMGGRRLGAWLPFVSLSHAWPKTPGGRLLAAGQHTATLGLRWDRIERQALKLQLDRVSGYGGPGLNLVDPGPATMPTAQAGIQRPVHVLSIALDFVF